MSGSTLADWLQTYRTSDNPHYRAAADLVSSFAKVAIEMRHVINEGALGAAFAHALESSNQDGDAQKALDVEADNLFLNGAIEAGVAYYASEEIPSPRIINEESPIAVAVDPLDGSSNIDTNISIGSIFSILPRCKSADETFLQRGSEQVGAGFFIYGPQLALVLTLGHGTTIFVYSARRDTFIAAYDNQRIAGETKEFAINVSNYRHWDETMRAYIDDCFSGTSGPREKDFNMRWIASLVADAYRILIRGGVFLYPRDNRKGYSAGRLRLVYEANPIAFLMEQAGAGAHDGAMRILDIEPHDLHQRTPLIFGSIFEVERVALYHADPTRIASRHPLFNNRGLFRA